MAHTFGMTLALGLSTLVFGASLVFAGGMRDAIGPEDRPMAGLKKPSPAGSDLRGNVGSGLRGHIDPATRGIIGPNSNLRGVIGPEDRPAAPAKKASPHMLVGPNSSTQSGV